MSLGSPKKIKGELRRKPGTLSHPVGVTGRDLSWGAGDLGLIPTVLPSCIELQGSSKFQASPCSPASVPYHVQRQTDSSHLQGLGDQLEKVLRIPRNPAGHGTPILSCASSGGARENTGHAQIHLPGWHHLKEAQTVLQATAVCARDHKHCIRTSQGCPFHPPWPRPWCGHHASPA